MKINNIAKEELNKYMLKKGSQNRRNAGYDLSIVECKDGSLSFCFYAPIFEKFNYVVFYAVENLLLMELTKETSDDSYAISKRKKSVTIKVAGINAKKIKDFVGKYKKMNFYNSTNSNPILYVDLKDKI